MGSFPFSMSRYRKLHTLAENLRKKGLSYKEIRREIPVSKSTMSEWCKDIVLTKQQIKRLGSRYDTSLRGAKANQRKSIERKRKAREQGIAEITGCTLEVLKIAGAMLYWAEGNKKNGTAVANSDPVFIVFFVRWLEMIAGIAPNRLAVYMHLHRGQNERQEKRFWSALTGIPIVNFRKTFFKPKGTGHRKNVLYHGTVQVRVQGQGVELLRHRILGWTEAVARQFVPKEIINIHYRGRLDHEPP